MAQPIAPHMPPPTRWRWGIVAMVGAGVAAAITRAYYGGKAGMLVLLVLLLANGAAIEAGRSPRQ